MFILMVYDVEVKRIVKVLKIGRKYLHHIQNSVLEGELSPAQYKKLKVLIPLTAVLPSSIFFVCRR
jgi:CRISPR-associated protein Cas2